MQVAGKRVECESSGVDVDYDFWIAAELSMWIN
jgi:hypothetical protein